MLDDLHPGEQLIEVGCDQIFQRQQNRFRRGIRGFRVVLPKFRRHEPIDLNEAVDVVGHLDACEMFAAFGDVFDGHRQIEAQAGDVRERVRRVDRERGQNREHLFMEVRGHPAALVVGQLVPGDDVNVVVRQGLADRVEEHPGVAFGQHLCALCDECQLLARRQSVGRPYRQAGFVSALEPGDTHHEELVEVRGEDGQELCPFEQGQRGVFCQRQNPGVEVEPTQFPVQVTVFGKVRCGGGGGGGCRRGGRHRRSRPGSGGR